MMKPILQLAIVAATLLSGAALTTAQAQGGPHATGAAFARADAGEATELSSALARGGYAVVIDLDQNRLFFRQGEAVLWSAPVGTGTGLRFKGGEREWDFSTPNGVFHVQYKEQDPVWIAPDWYFLENDLPVPPPDDKKRYFPGGLGAAAVYIGEDLAIHGTDKPELLGQRVSHGCIRLADKDALRLFHNVQIGTEVVIVGGEDIQKRRAEAGKGNDPSTFSPGAKKPRPKDPQLEEWKRMPTGELLWELSSEFWRDPEASRWAEVAGLLVRRGLKGDDDALAGLMLRVADLPYGRVEREYRTFLADAFAREALRTLRVLSELDREDRARAAEAIVQASIGLYSGDLEAPSAPWPTSRVPESSIGPRERLGWNALRRAERDLRRHGAEWRA